MIKHNDDISNQTVFILAILTILISILGVATIFYETSTMDRVVVVEPDATSGKITLEISQPSKAIESNSSGSIKLDLLNDDL